MQNCFVFMLDNDKDFLKLYSTILQNKGCKIFATDNLFIFMEYAKTIKPYWIFIDENYASFPAEIIINIIQSKITSDTEYTIMSKHKNPTKKSFGLPINYIYKPQTLEKIIKIAEMCCIVQ